MSIPLGTSGRNPHLLQELLRRGRDLLPPALIRGLSQQQHFCMAKIPIEDNRINVFKHTLYLIFTPILVFQAVNQVSHPIV